jgi:peptide deformylase
MAVREIRLLGDPVLRKEAKEVEVFDEALQSLVEDMFETMAAEEGAGLAAPQVGISLRVMVVDVRREAGPRGRVALVNPRVVEVGEEVDRGPEGCLSIPGVSEVVARPARVVMEGKTPQGETIRVEGENLFARALLHELDHLDGVLFIDRLSPLKRKMLLRKYRKLQEEG